MYTFGDGVATKAKVNWNAFESFINNPTSRKRKHEFEFPEFTYKLKETESLRYVKDECFSNMDKEKAIQSLILARTHPRW